jgi:hypothetical protein
MYSETFEQSAPNADPDNTPIEYNSNIIGAADVALTVADTYYDVATLGTLPPGLYLVSANVHILNGAIAASFFNTKIMVGAVAYAPTESSIIISGSQEISTPPIPIQIAAAAGAIVKVQAAAHTTGAVAKYTLANGGANTNPCWINAVRIK